MSAEVETASDESDNEDLPYYDCADEENSASGNSYDDAAFELPSELASSPTGSLGNLDSGASPYNSRTQLPAVMFKRSNFAAFQLLRHLVGKDLTRVTIPVIFDEPLTFLQRLGEYCEYFHLLCKASESDNPVERIQYVVAFAVSASATNRDRLNKPFNPLLGETFELRRNQFGFHFVAEQVSHHPPISALFCEWPGVFKFYGSFEPRMRFWGKHLHASPHGVLTVELPRHGEVYSWQNVHMNVHNIIIGKLWIELFGDLEVLEHTKGHRAVVTYKRSKWLRRNRHCEIQGFVEDKHRNRLRNLYGAWDDALFSIPVDVDPEQVCEPCNEHEAVQCDRHLPSQILLWRAVAKPKSASFFYNFTNFALMLNELGPEERALNLPPTDSRFRPDLRLLEDGRLQAAADAKHSLEHEQRVRMKNLDWLPRWFNCEAHPFRAMDTWVFNYKYFSRDWSHCPKIFDVPSS